MKFTLILLITATHFLSCATTPTVEDSISTKVDAKISQDFKLTNTPSKSSSGLVDYKHDKQSLKAQWVQCVGKPGAPFVVFFHGNDSGGNNPQTFCSEWSAQVLLKNGFNVAAVNRPSFSGSNGKDDLGGPQSIAANMAGIKAATGGGAVLGFWGVESGVIAATFTAKSWPNLKWLILGSGFYDLESLERSTKNDRLSKLIASLKTSEGDAALERRSIAWDISGLPSLVAIYHSKNDDVAPKHQADDFNSQLRTAQTKVFYDEVEAPSGALPWQAQYQIVDKAIKQLSKSK